MARHSAFDLDECKATFRPQASASVMETACAFAGGPGRIDIAAPDAGGVVQALQVRQTSVRGEVHVGQP